MGVDISLGKCLGNVWGGCLDPTQEYSLYVQQLCFVPPWSTHTLTHSQTDRQILSNHRS